MGCINRQEHISDHRTNETFATDTVNCVSPNEISADVSNALVAVGRLHVISEIGWLQIVC